MKNYFTAPITSLAEAHAFFDQLHADGLLFHPEDAPESVVDAFGLALFTSDECDVLELRLLEVSLFDEDPCEYCMTFNT